MHVHFVCTGNLYRSRMAEAYLRSKAVPGVMVSSSGTLAEAQDAGPMAHYAARILADRQLTPFLSPSWTQTDTAIFGVADYVVFMMEEHRAYCCEHFEFGDRPHAVWNVPDLEVVVLPDGVTPEERAAVRFREAERTFDRIAEHVDALVLELGAALN